MQLSELIAAAGVAVRQKVGGDENIERVVYDSRAAVPETLFVCIRGFTGDGHASVSYTHLTLPTNSLV